MIINSPLKKQLADKLGKSIFLKVLLDSGTKPEFAEVLWEDYLQFLLNGMAALSAIALPAIEYVAG